MNIQEESLGPADPLATLEEDYGFAVLHIAWDLHRDTRVRTLLFAFVELVPEEIPPPIDDYDPKHPRSGCRLGSDSPHRLYLRHAVVPARDGLGWYLACRRGEARLPPAPNATAAQAIAGDLQLAVPPFDDEPRWPTLCANAERCDAVPFAPHWIYWPRTHHLLPTSEVDLSSLWSASERAKAEPWLADRLHFSFAEYPEYWCSVHLVAPNPVYRLLEVRRQPRTPPAESVLARFEPRRGRALEGLELTLRESTASGTTTMKRCSVGGPLVRANFAREVHGIASDVWDPLRGLLQLSSDGHVFLRSVQASIGLSRTVVVPTTAGPVEVTKSSGFQDMAVGTPGPPTAARSRMVSALYAREARRAAERHDQRWFKDQKDDARAVLQRLIRKAHEHVLFVDPYFAAPELEFAIAVGRDDIPVRILTSAEVLTDSVSKTDTVENGDRLADLIEQVRAIPHMNPFIIRVMRGDRPAVHDRFLAIDERIWALGSSLNEFGSRGTMLLGLPSPDAIRPDLESAWDDAEPFETWIEERRRNRTQPGASS